MNALMGAMNGAWRGRDTPVPLSVPFPPKQPDCPTSPSLSPRLNSSRTLEEKLFHLENQGKGSASSGIKDLGSSHPLSMALRCDGGEVRPGLFSGTGGGTGGKIVRVFSPSRTNADNRANKMADNMMEREGGTIPRTLACPPIHPVALRQSQSQLKNVPHRDTDNVTKSVQVEGRLKAESNTLPPLPVSAVKKTKEKEKERGKGKGRMRVTVQSPRHHERENIAKLANTNTHALPSTPTPSSSKVDSKTKDAHTVEHPSVTAESALQTLGRVPLKLRPGVPSVSAALSPFAAITAREM